MRYIEKVSRYLEEQAIAALLGRSLCLASEFMLKGGMLGEIDGLYECFYG